MGDGAKTNEQRTPIVRLVDVSKRFNKVQALADVSFDVYPGEVHVLLGENGAGKSTLIKCLAGVHRPDEGTISIAGENVSIRTASDAEDLGIATIHQELNLVPDLSVAENIMLGRQPSRWGFIDKAEMINQATKAMEVVGLEIDPKTKVRDLGVARMQLVEIAKAISLDARILVLDEPTATLTSAETENLLNLMDHLRDKGVAMVFISHHLDEITAIGDRVTILRDGRSIETVPASTPEEELVSLMVGRPLEDLYPHEQLDPGEVVLSVSNLGTAGRFKDISFEVRAGEVVGLAGLVGAGRTEVARAIFGADAYDEGSVSVDGDTVEPRSITSAMAAGIGLVPEDRKVQGLILEASIVENLGLVTLGEATHGGFVDRRGQRNKSTAIAEKLRIRMSSIDAPVKDLSGGNQQKVVIGKWLLTQTRLLILDEPTRGVDVGAKTEIYDLIDQLTAAGNAVLVISSDLPEILGITDRVLVMARGRLVGDLPTNETDQDAVMALAVKEVEPARVE